MQINDTKRGGLLVCAQRQIEKVYFAAFWWMQKSKPLSLQIVEQFFCFVNDPLH